MNLHLIFPTPFGDAAIIFRENPFSMIKILLPGTTNQGELSDSAEINDKGLCQNALTVSESIINYFKGKPVRLRWEQMDMGRLTSLQKSVLAAVADIPYGEVRSYKEIAHTIKRPRACRFVGTTVAKNPFPILIPCHRVVRSDGSIGKFGGGTELKRKLIELESEYSSHI
ncbi:MAG: methylated-DNA--[protein]-cysteine S-methyltransferase [Desulfobacterales bacterium]|nr:methylated-DNA--[protein]-cysteine S-methyltransferase [Desulfobacterales bacterium]